MFDVDYDEHKIVRSDDGEYETWDEAQSELLATLEDNADDLDVEADGLHEEADMLRAKANLLEVSASWEDYCRHNALCEELLQVCSPEPTTTEVELATGQPDYMPLIDELEAKGII